MMLEHTELCQEIMELPDYDKLKIENDSLRRQVKSLTGELKRVLGDDGEISEECWNEVSSSLFDNIEDLRSEWGISENLIEI